MSAEEERPPSPPPLLAYTVSQQQIGKGKGNTAKKTKSGKHVIAPIRRKRAAEPILFDEENRREFLTGFRKRKQARIETGRKKALEREKEERRRSRAETRKARQEQAAENVRMEKIAYGNGDDDDDDQDDQEQSENDQREKTPSAYETEEHHTTVTVQEWNPEEEEEDAGRLAKEKAAARMKKLQDSLPPSSRRAAKKLKNASKQPIPTNGKKLADPRKISKLLDVDESIEVPTLIELENSAAKGKDQDEGEVDEKKKKPSKFYYESKLERAKAKAKIKENKLRWAERRKEERLEANKHDRNRMRKGGKSKKKK